MAGAEAAQEILAEYGNPIWVYFKEVYTENTALFHISFKLSIADFMDYIKTDVKVWFDIDENNFEIVLMGINDNEDAVSIMESCYNINISLK